MIIDFKRGMLSIFNCANISAMQTKIQKTTMDMNYTRN
jgi:hypothetical protein